MPGQLPFPVPLWSIETKEQIPHAAYLPDDDTPSGFGISSHRHDVYEENLRFTGKLNPASHNVFEGTPDQIPFIPENF